jgi:hypothetical protein
MRHPALRRSARHTSKREARSDPAKAVVPTDAVPPEPGTPPDGEHNQGGVRNEGIEYQRDLGSEQDA